MDLSEHLQIQHFALLLLSHLLSLNLHSIHRSHHCQLFSHLVATKLNLGEVAVPKNSALLRCTSLCSFPVNTVSISAVILILSLLKSSSSVSIICLKKIKITRYIGNHLLLYLNWILHRGTSITDLLVAVLLALITMKNFTVQTFELLGKIVDRFPQCFRLKRKLLFFRCSFVWPIQ